MPYDRAIATHLSNALHALAHYPPIIYRLECTRQRAASNNALDDQSMSQTLGEFVITALMTRISAVKAGR